MLRLAGELDLTSGGHLRDALDTQLGLGRTRLVLDMAELDFVDSTGLSVLIEFSKKSAHDGGQLVLAAPQPHPAKILKIAGVDRAIPVYPDIADAIVATASGSAPAQ